MLFRRALRSRLTRNTCVSSWTPSVLCRRFSNLKPGQRDEAVSLEVGGNGFVDLKITRPSHPTEDNNILVHLPRGAYPNGQGAQTSTSIDIESLSKQLPSATIVDLQYRLSKHGTQPELDHRFPTPIHDIFTAWDYITDDSSPSNVLTRDGQHSHKKAKICLCGSHIGGALAITLALTNPSQIHAVVIRDPIVDWTGLDEIATHTLARAKRGITYTAKKRERDRLADAAQALIKLRTQLFRTPSGYFDPFASPTLFLRSAGRDTPPTKTAAPVEPEVGFIEGTPIRYGEEDDEVGIVEAEPPQTYGPYDDDWHTLETKQMREEYYNKSTSPGTYDGSARTVTSADGDSDSATVTTAQKLSVAAVVPQLQRRRKVLQRWPPTSQPEEVVLPHVNLFLTRPDLNHEVGHDQLDILPVTWTQGTELLDLLRRACFWGREKSFAEERVITTELIKDQVADDLGLEDAGEWLRTMFEKD